VLQGELTELDTQVPVLYMDTPLGRLKFQGTIVYPKSRYMVLKVGSSRHIVCEDVFEHIVRHHMLLRSDTFSHIADITRRHALRPLLCCSHGTCWYLPSRHSWAAQC
jgi:hypothetical protein